MSENPLTKKVAVPYVRALFDLSIETNIMHQITGDFYNLSILLNESSELTDYLSNPVVSQKAKREILAKTLKSQINDETFKFLLFLLDRNRINLLSSIVNSYIELMFKTARIKTVEVVTSSPFSASQEDKLVQKLKKLINARAIQLVVTVDPTLIGGFLIKTESKLIDFTVKNKLQELAKRLNTVLEI